MPSKKPKAVMRWILYRGQWPLVDHYGQITLGKTKNRINWPVAQNEYPVRVRIVPVSKKRRKDAE